MVKRNRYLCEMRAFILAGGLGTRLQPLTNAAPKVMLPVAGRPFLEILVGHLARAGVADIVLCVGYRAEAIRAHFGDGARWGVHLAYSVETRPLGTGGALRRAASGIGQTFLVLNGDSFVSLDIAALAHAHRERLLVAPACLGTIVLARVEEAQDFGAVAVDGAGWVARFEEKTARRGGGVVNGGVYLLEPQLLDLIPPEAPTSLELDVFPRVAGRLAGFHVDAPLYDIGTPERLAEAERVLSWLGRASA